MYSHVSPPDALELLSAGATTVQRCHGDAGCAPRERRGTLQLAACSLPAASSRRCDPPTLPLHNSLDAGRGHACGPKAPGLSSPERGHRMGRPLAAPAACALRASQGFGGVVGGRAGATVAARCTRAPKRKLKPLYEEDEGAPGAPGPGPGPDPLSP